MASMLLEMVATVSEKRAMIMESSSRMTRRPKSAVSKKALTTTVRSSKLPSVRSEAELRGRLCGEQKIKYYT